MEGRAFGKGGRGQVRGRLGRSRARGRAGSLRRRPSDRPPASTSLKQTRAETSICHPLSRCVAPCRSSDCSRLWSPSSRSGWRRPAGRRARARPRADAEPFDLQAKQEARGRPGSRSPNCTTQSATSSRAASRRSAPAARGCKGHRSSSTSGRPGADRAAASSRSSSRPPLTRGKESRSSASTRDDKVRPAKKFLAAVPAPVPVLHGPGREDRARVSAPADYPMTQFIDRDGKPPTPTGRYTQRASSQGHRALLR